MAAIDTTRSVAATGFIGQAIANITAAFTAWNDARTTRKVLSQLSDRELDDIGLTRAEVNRIGIYH